MRVVEDLQFNGLRIAVDKPGFSYGRDAVLLADFARPRPGDRALDLCAGTGILAILVSGRTGASFTAVELQPRAAELARESVEMNGQQGRIQVLCADIRALALPPGSFDCALCNPPYHSGGTPSPDPAKRLSTHQGECGIYDAAACAARLLKNGGKLWLCYPAGRLAECCHALVAQGLEPKRIRLVEGRGGKPYLALIEAKKGGGVGIVWE